VITPTRKIPFQKTQDIGPLGGWGSHSVRSHGPGMRSKGIKGDTSCREQNTGSDERRKTGREETNHVLEGRRQDASRCPENVGGEDKKRVQGFGAREGRRR